MHKVPVLLLGKIGIHCFRNNHIAICWKKTICCNHHFNSVHHFIAIYQSLASRMGVHNQVKWDDKISRNFFHLLTCKLVILLNFFQMPKIFWIFASREYLFVITVHGKFSVNAIRTFVYIIYVCLCFYLKKITDFNT